jgi:hypothetical protein
MPLVDLLELDKVHWCSSIVRPPRRPGQAPASRAAAFAPVGMATTPWPSPTCCLCTRRPCGLPPPCIRGLPLPLPDPATPAQVRPFMLPPCSSFVCATAASSLPGPRASSQLCSTPRDAAQPLQPLRHVAATLLVPVRVEEAR